MNVSEGRESLEALTRAAGRSLLDLHVDGDHHRSVLTLAGPGIYDAEAAARQVTMAAAAQLDLTDHDGAHPRLGAIDVVPFVALAPTDRGDAIAAAHRYGAWIVQHLGVPVFFYDMASPTAVSLPEVRRNAFGSQAPDLGPAHRHPRLGAVSVGAREVLVAVNCELDAGDIALARRIAQSIRERDGGLAGVRALGMMLESRSRAQVSMNLIDLQKTGLERACEEVRAHARAAGTDVVAVELVGLIPEAELRRCSSSFLTWSGLHSDQAIEARLASVAAGGSVSATEGDSTASLPHA